MGRLTPIFVAETLPNDTWYLNCEVLMRFAPMLAPIMHRVTCYVHWFFVNNRILWEDWEDFITNGRLGTETPPVPPFQRIGTILTWGQDLLDQGSLADYMGIPPIPDTAAGTWSTRMLDIMPVAAYQQIYQDYYRDRNYEADVIWLPAVSGLNEDVEVEFWSIKTRKWEHDYFTSSLLFTQRGQEVLMPLQGSGTVTYMPQSLVRDASGADWGPGAIGAIAALNLEDVEGALQIDPNGATGLTDVHIENIDEVIINASSVSMNDFRTAVALQEWMERQALGGSRINETIYAHFNRRTSDGRLQMAEYLGGGKVVAKISEVMTTAWSEDGDTNLVPPANMTGASKTLGSSNRISYNCEEWGFIVGIMSVMPSSAYMQGIPRMFLQRNQFEDYPWPTLAHLGEQPVYDYEIYADPTSVPVDRTTAPVFGYNSRYVDWKFINSSAHGDFRTTLDHWHLTRKFASQPQLSEEFVTFENALQDRIFAVAEVDTLWCYLYNNARVKRTLPYFATPAISSVRV